MLCFHSPSLLITTSCQLGDSLLPCRGEDQVFRMSTWGAANDEQAVSFQGTQAMTDITFVSVKGTYPNMATTSFTLVGNSADSRGLADVTLCMATPNAGPRPLCPCRHVPGGAYVARFQTTVTVPPPDAAAAPAVNVSSSPVMVNGSFSAVPFQLGNVELSIFKVSVLSAGLTDTVPK